jgi:putative acetyltransferase
MVRMSVTIRPARPDDAAAICAVHRASIVGICSACYTPHEIDTWAGLLTPDKYGEPLQKQVMFVAEREDEIVGFSQLDADRALVLAVYVSPRAVGTGIGRALLQQLEAAAHQRGITRLVLDATLNAEAFYAHAGYQRLRMNEHRIGLGVALACVRMEKSLP